MEIFASAGSVKNEEKKIFGKKNGITFESREFSGTMDSQSFWDSLSALAKKEKKYIVLMY